MPEIWCRFHIIQYWSPKHGQNMNQFTKEPHVNTILNIFHLTEEYLHECRVIIMTVNSQLRSPCDPFGQYSTIRFKDFTNL